MRDASFKLALCGCFVVVCGEGFPAFDVVSEKFYEYRRDLPQASSPTSKQITLSQSDHPVSATTQLEINISLANWIASIGRPISIVEDDGLKQVLQTELKNAKYKLPCRRTIDKILTVCITTTKKCQRSSEERKGNCTNV